MKRKLYCDSKNDLRHAQTILDGMFTRLKQRGGRRSKMPPLTEQFICFDIETTTAGKDSFCWHWQMLIDDLYIYGRNLHFAVRLFKWLSGYLKRRKMRTLCFVHNLAFEYQFLYSQLKMSDILAHRTHQVIRCRHGAITFQCTYCLSRRSLASWAAFLNVEHGKLTGDLDYSVYRDYDTVLTPREQLYMYYDVISLQECVRQWLADNHYTLYTMAVTKTGILRKKVKAVRKHWARTSYAMNANVDLHRMLRNGFRGGDTHASLDYVDKVLYDVESYDRTSSYPAVMCTKKFPMSTFRKAPCFFDEVAAGRATIGDVTFKNLRPRMECYIPYLSRSKCVTGPCIEDNGRVIAADWCRTTITDIDWQIIQWYYEWDDVTPGSYCYSANYDYLPEAYRQLVQESFFAKTAYKNVVGRELDYALAKEDINSYYGLTAQSPFPVEYRHDRTTGRWTTRLETCESKLKETLHRRVTPYAWGVWVTAWARYELNDLIRQNADRVVYWDTDSIKYVGGTLNGLEEYNAVRQQAAVDAGACAQAPDGHTEYMGVFGYEGRYDTFKTLGAKRYAYTQDGELHITVAGVPKGPGAAALAKAGGLEVFSDSFTYHDVHALTSYYRDTPKVFPGRRPVYSGSGLALVEGPISMNLTDNYRYLLERGLERILDEFCAMERS